VDGREVINFASNDYLGLAGDPRVIRAAAAALDEGGAGVGASRLIVGNHRQHVVLAAAVADWPQCGAARLVNTGHAANVGALHGVVPDVLIGTFGKALGAFGAFAATSRAVADLLWNRARPLVFSTGLPPSVPAAARAAIDIVRGTEGDARRATLASHAARLR